MGSLSLLSVIIPVKDEEACIASTVEHLYIELRLKNIPHEIVVVDDGSLDNTRKELEDARQRVPTLVSLQNPGPHGFGRAELLLSGAHGWSRTCPDAEHA